MNDELVKTADPQGEAHDSIMVADNPLAFAGMQAGLREWSISKIAAERAELDEIEKSIEIARKAKWSMSALNTRRTKALDRVLYYEKIQAALSDGYILFPPLTNDITLFAVRTDAESTPGRREITGGCVNKNSSEFSVTNRPEFIGDGKYISPTIKMVVINRWKDDKGNDKKMWEDSDEFSAVQFPLTMCRAQVVEKASDAMAKLLFDALGVSVPPGRHQDPVIIGRIYGERMAYRRRRYCDFLISWRVDTRSI